MKELLEGKVDIIQNDIKILQKYADIIHSKIQG